MASTHALPQEDEQTVPWEQGPACLRDSTSAHPFDDAGQRPPDCDHERLHKPDLDDHPPHLALDVALASTSAVSTASPIADVPKKTLEKDGASCRPALSVAAAVKAAQEPGDREAAAPVGGGGRSEAAAIEAARGWEVGVGLDAHDGGEGRCEADPPAIVPKELMCTVVGSALVISAPLRGGCEVVASGAPSARSSDQSTSKRPPHVAAAMRAKVGDPDGVDEALDLNSMDAKQSEPSRASGTELGSPEVRGSHGRAIRATTALALANAPAAIAWFSCTSLGAAAGLVSGESSGALRDGTTCAEVVILMATLFQLGYSVSRVVVAAFLAVAKMPPAERGLCAGWRALHFDMTLTLKHVFCGIWHVLSDLLLLMTISVSSPSFASTLRLVGSVFLTVVLRYLILGRRASGLQMILLASLLLVASGFAGLQSARMSSSAQSAQIGLAVLLGSVSTSLSALMAVYSEAVFQPRPGETQIRMAAALRQTFILLGSLLGITVWCVAVLSMRAGHFEHRIWQPFGGPGPRIAGTLGVANVAALFTLQLCGALPYALVSIVRLALIYTAKIIFLGGVCNLWELLICCAVVSLCAFYMLSADLMGPQSRREIGQKVVEMERKARDTTANGLRNVRNSMQGLRRSMAERGTSTAAQESRTSSEGAWQPASPSIVEHREK